MSLTYRRAFFYLSIGLFLFLAPLVVLFTAGYRINFSTGQFVQVGALTAASIPKGATIKLDGNTLQVKTPTLVKRALPGTYRLELSKDGYETWARDIEIKSRQTTTIEDAVLFLRREPEKILDLQPSTSAASPDGSVVAYEILAEPWFELWQYDLARSEFLLLDRVSSKQIVDPHLYWTQSGVLQGPVFKKDASSEFQFETVGEHTGLMRLDNLGERTTRALLPLGVYRIADVVNHLVLIQNVDEQKIILVDTATDGPPILLNANAEFYHLADGALLYSDGFELHRYDLETTRDVLITRSGTLLTDVVPFPYGQTLLIVSGGTVIASDISDPSRPVNTTIVSVDHIQSFWTDGHGRNGFFFGTVEGVPGLYKIALTK